tara:strand:- start:483 stop:986 length:504 start_codon:yes stop_codon:yes gene_type:complete
MEAKDLHQQLLNYQTAIANVDSYRKNWKKTKKLILSTLKLLNSELKLSLKIETEENFEGMEMVYATLGKRKSGIAEKIEGTKRYYFKEGGFLAYTQLFNGKISVWITLPTIENLMETPAPEPLHIYKPSEITKEVVQQNLAVFFKDMTEWEDQDLQHHEVGYKMRNS